MERREVSKRNTKSKVSDNHDRTREAREEESGRTAVWSLDNQETCGTLKASGESGRDITQ